MSRPTRIPWPPVLFAAACALAVVARRVYPLPWPGMDDTAARVIGYGFGAVGLALIAWGGITLRRAGTTVRPDAGADRLVTDGPFRYRRNPIYMGEVLLFLGLAEATHNIWFVIAGPLFAIALYHLAILPEEQYLENRFGKAYLDYKERTRRWF